MIREERDPAFWQAILDHPEVAKAAITGQQGLAEVITHPSVIPLAAQHGGYLFCRLDAIGHVYELHSMFTPQGWGREAMTAGAGALDIMFAKGMQVLTTYEVSNNPRSRPPKRFGFTRAGEFQGPHGLRSWVLTRAAWEASPGRNCFTMAV